MYPFPSILPRDNDPLSPSDMILAKTICGTVQGLVNNRQEYIQDSQVDPDFALPQANWSLDSPNEFVRVYKTISAGRPEIISHLRLFAQVFTGFNMIHVKPGYGLSSPEIVPEDLDAKIEGNLTAYFKEWPRRWRALVKDIPERVIYKAPHKLGEVGLEVDGVLVNNDVIVYQERINLLYEVGLIEWLEKRLRDKGKLRILEIGGGYGAIASWFKMVFPESSYTLIDLPECLIFSSLYLSLTQPEISRSFGVSDESVGWQFVPNYMAEKLTDRFDLVINTLSMSEMSRYQVEKYMKLMRQSWLADGGLFFEQNQNNRNRGLLCAEDIIKNKLPHRLRITSSKTPLTQGAANIWGMSDILLPWKNLSLLNRLKSIFLD